MPEYRRTVRSTDAFEGAETATPGVFRLEPEILVEVVSDDDPTFVRVRHFGKELHVRREDTVVVAEQERARMPSRSSASPVTAPPTVDYTLFCPQCASPLHAAATYCRQCGSNLMARGVAGRDFATFRERLGALLIDAALTSVATLLLLLFLVGGGSIAEYIVLAAIISAPYYTVGYALGATPGALVLGLRVLTVDGVEAGVAKGFIRWIGAFVSALPLGLGYFWMRRDPDAQTWHDRMSGTFVVKDLKAQLSEIEKRSGE